MVCNATVYNGLQWSAMICNGLPWFVMVWPQQLYKRHGAPRTHWFEDSLNVALQRLDNDPNIIFDNSNEAHIQAIKQAATERKI